MKSNRNYRKLSKCFWKIFKCLKPLAPFIKPAMINVLIWLLSFENKGHKTYAPHFDIKIQFYIQFEICKPEA